MNSIYQKNIALVGSLTLEDFHFIFEGESQEVIENLFRTKEKEKSDDCIQKFMLGLTELQFSKLHEFIKSTQS
jgi:hypothetical protein